MLVIHVPLPADNSRVHHADPWIRRMEPSLWLLERPRSDCGLRISRRGRVAGFVGDGARPSHGLRGSGMVNSLGVGASVTQNGIRVDCVSVAIGDHGAKFLMPSFEPLARRRRCSKVSEPTFRLGQRRFGERRRARLNEVLTLNQSFGHVGCRLGNTSVNKAIRGALANKAGHASSILGHNGLIILCSSADNSKNGELTIKDYTVVNGAQSLTSFYNDKSKLTDDLRVLVRVVEVQDEALARRITENSNNQNAIKPRDLRSNHAIQLRLQKEMNDADGDYFFEIKRGEKAPAGATVITNDQTGRALLAFDVREPWSAHQIYKVFDEKYAEIFGRPEVTAKRAIFVHRLMGVVDNSLPKLKNRPMASYTLTRYFMLCLLSEILRANDVSRPYVANPASLTQPQLEEFLAKCEEILKTVVVDLNVESKSVDFDYKSILKSPKQGGELAQSILASYEKDVEREKAETFTDWTPS